MFARLLLSGLFLLGASGRAYAQIADDFSDGNFSANPAWTGDVADFVVDTAGQLQLMAPEAGASTLAVAGNIPDSAVWNLYVRLEFAPSAANRLRIYLQADQPDLPLASGYLLELGENGSDDALRLLRQDDGATALLATGQTGLAASDPVELQIRVRRSPDGLWTLEAAPPGLPPALQGQVQDNTYGGGSGVFFGFHCIYTATRTDKFFFDNVAIQAGPPDMDAPVLTGAQAVNASLVELTFDEPLAPAPAQDLANYTISGLGQPASALLAAGPGNTVLLGLSQMLTNGATYTVQAVNLADATGNVAGPQTIAFTYSVPETASEFDVLINEIMFDPTPSAGLPEVEWIELYNRSGKVLDLASLLLDDGGSALPLSAYSLAPGAYVVLSGPAGVAALAPITPQALAVSGFPSLNNSGDLLSLRHETGALIDQVAYTPDWHDVPDKEDGGWSLERINPHLPCLGGENWRSCPVLPGGTPGAANASLQTGPDVQPPRLLSVFPLAPDTLRLAFSEGLDAVSALATTAYHLDPPRALAAVEVDTEDRRQVLLVLAEPLETGQVYRLGVSSAVTDCAGNAVEPGLDTFRIGLPEDPSPGDVVLNEILFNPASGGARFLEFYNRSAKIFNLKNFFLANFAGGSSVTPIGLDRLFLPGEFLVFTTDPPDIKERFGDVDPRKLLEVVLPSLDDRSGNVTLYWAGPGPTVVIDSFDYDEDYHNALYTSSDREGVSLERLDVDRPTQQASNWTSAAQPGGFAAGTPTRSNSQRSHATGAPDDLIRLTAERISPDQDGYEDFLDIRYRLPSAGFFAALTIYDSNGQVVRRLVRQELLGAEGALRWDGDTDRGGVARPGIYILRMELFHPDGEVREVKKTFALVRRF
jgi:hypothetical protein